MVWFSTQPSMELPKNRFHSQASKQAAAQEFCRHERTEHGSGRRPSLGTNDGGFIGG